MNALLSTTQIDDEETLEYLMQSFVDIARVNYDYLENYLQKLGEMTFEQMTNNQREKVATLAIEFWTTICEVEIERIKNGQDHKNIIMGCSQSLLQIFI